MKRDTFEFSPDGTKLLRPDGLLDITSSEDGILIEVTDDVACGSYNTEACCRTLVPKADAERLRDWLIDVLASSP